MKTTLIRILLATLAALMLLTAAACRKDSADDPGYILNPSADAPESEIAAFYKGNAASLQALVKGMMKSRGFLAYNYSSRMIDYNKGTMEFYLQKQEKYGGVWVECQDEAPMRLVGVKFVGTVTYNPIYSKDVVVLVPRMAAADKTLSLVYCTSEAGKTAVESGKYHPGCNVTLTQIEGDWYCAEATKSDK